MANQTQRCQGSLGCKLVPGRKGARAVPRSALLLVQGQGVCSPAPYAIDVTDTGNYVGYLTRKQVGCKRHWVGGAYWEELLKWGRRCPDGSSAVHPSYLKNGDSYTRHTRSSDMKNVAQLVGCLPSLHEGPRFDSPGRHKAGMVVHVCALRSRGRGILSSMSSLPTLLA